MPLVANVSHRAGCRADRVRLSTTAISAANQRDSQACGVPVLSTRRVTAREITDHSTELVSDSSSIPRRSGRVPKKPPRRCAGHRSRPYPLLGHAPRLSTMSAWRTKPSVYKVAPFPFLVKDSCQQGTDGLRVSVLPSPHPPRGYCDRQKWP